jgi:hypothetical protein
VFMIELREELVASEAYLECSQPVG